MGSIYPCSKDDHEIADTILLDTVALFKRPFYLDFLNFCFENFEVGIWSAGSRLYAETVVEYLLGDNKNKLLFCFNSTHCTRTSFSVLEATHRERLKFKDLRKIWDKQDPNLNFQKGCFNETNTLLIDDSPYHALLNPPHTVIMPDPFTHLHKDDNSLGDGGELKEYLKELANAENIPKFVEEHPFGQQPINETSPSWNYYQQAIQSLSNSA
ncbi:hypothetical protein PIB30_059181 [Stylosanthes scabra]|uniref:Mitochondrial import inner membrane translocase subunit TIM50 n=1 Tax=Stylosanthes scabra TaxID=79078 RepID=A0ABU6TKT2_9FABA|nr:hypothetical protein [Stylosanthes scabra]